MSIEYCLIAECRVVGTMLSSISSSLIPLFSTKNYSPVKGQPFSQTVSSTVKSHQVK